MNVLCCRMLAIDERILPSTDSHSDLAFDGDCLQTCHVAVEQPDSLCQGYAPGHAVHRTPFQQPTDSEARPLRRSSTEATATNDDDDIGVGSDGCHGEY